MNKNRLILGAMALGLSTGAFAQPEKFVVVEEKTGTWCGWCPYGTVAFANLEEDEPNFIGIAVHNGDPMAVSSYDDATGSLPDFSGYPYACADRVEGDHAFYATDGFAARENETPAASIEAVGIVDGDQLEIKILANFTEQQTGDWRLAGVVVEDGVTGSGSGYAQANYFPGSGYELTGAGKVWHEEPNPVPATDMVYDHVARALGDDEWEGVDASLPETMDADVNYWFSYYVDLDPSWDLSNLHVVGMLVEPDGTINNAGKGNVGTVGIEEEATNNFAITAYPNPASQFVNMSIELQEAANVKVEVVNMLGAVVTTIETQNLNAGTHYNELNVADLTEGVYFIKSTINDAVEMTRIVVQH